MCACYGTGGLLRLRWPCQLVRHQFQRLHVAQSRLPDPVVARQLRAGRDRVDDVLADRPEGLLPAGGREVAYVERAELVVEDVPESLAGLPVFDPRREQLQHQLEHAERGRPGVVLGQEDRICHQPPTMKTLELFSSATKVL